MIKNFYKKIFKGFSLIEVIIAVNLLALILAILGLSALGSQK
ncbi:MAG: prepilin-type N-terminal cleavage/methylation domain-containing protein, partial [bacterium]